MKRLLSLAVVLTLLVQPAMAQTVEVADRAISRFIIPGYAQFTETAELMAKAMDGLCAEPTDDSYAAAELWFGSLVETWSRIEIIRFGPVLRENRLERILFWPDRRSTGLKQVQAAIATSDESAASVGTLRGKSVAVQGLGALEYVLYGTGAGALIGTQNTYRCRYGRAIAEAIWMTASEVLADWTAEGGIADALRNPAPERPDYRNRDEVLRELVGVIIHGMELVRDTRLKPFFGETPEKSNHRLALFWRSGLPLFSAATNVAAIGDYFEASGLGLLLPQDGQAADQLDFETGNFLRTADGIELALEDALADDDARAAINYLLILTQSIQNIALNQISAGLGLTVGFSSLDGD